MPELPEVETTRAGLAPHLEGRRVRSVLLRRPDLRWPIPPEVSERLPGQRIAAVRRRAKYLLLDTDAGSALLHLGMSGSLRVLPAKAPVRAHDHVDLALDSGRVLRFNDPRRFGCLLWQPAGETHALLRELGPEPLSEAFDGDYLYERSRGRQAPVKSFLMDQKVVVGVGNIYAAEALFAAGISPLRAAGKVSRGRYEVLAGEGEAHPRPCHRPRRDDAARFHRPRRRAGLFRTGTGRLRARWRTLPALRPAAQAGHDRPARQRLVRALPALKAATGPAV